MLNGADFTTIEKTQDNTSDKLPFNGRYIPFIVKGKNYHTTIDDILARNGGYLGLLPTVVASPFIRIQIPTTDGTKFIIAGSVVQTLNNNDVYGIGFIKNFTITIPSKVRPLANFYSLSVQCITNDKVVIPSFESVTKDVISGWVQSNVKSQANVTFLIFGIGY